MAEIQGSLGSSQYDQKSIPPMVDVELVMITGRMNDNGTEFIKHQIVNCSHQELIGEMFDVGYSFKHANPTAQRIAIQELRKVAHACQLDPNMVEDTNQMFNIPFIAEIFYQANDTAMQYPKLRNYKAKVRGATHTPPIAAFGGLPQHSTPQAPAPAPAPAAPTWGQPQSSQ